ncbi:MAG TPA: hypothetical protein VHY77_10760 [Acidimicrobiales bacterium]|nr:hypothetical protein [Acidimicrobiales bacterium]
MTAFLMSVTMQFASGWHVQNRVLWIVIGVLFILLLAAVYLIIRIRMGNADRSHSQGSVGPPD